MKIFKGRIFSFLRKPEDINDTGSYIYLENGAVVCDHKGVILEIADFSDLDQKYKDAKIEDFGSKIICPGFIDLHNHFLSCSVHFASLLQHLASNPPPDSQLDHQGSCRVAR